MKPSELVLLSGFRGCLLALPAGGPPVEHLRQLPPEDPLAPGAAGGS